MKKTPTKHITFIIYDSILNSVFQSCVLRPIMKMIEKSENVEVTLISFEPLTLRRKNILMQIPAHNKLHLILCRRLPFTGKFSLRVATFQLKRILKLLPSNHIIARGPLAGWVVSKALESFARKSPERMRVESQNPLPPLTIQARGLAAEEYRFYKQQTPTTWLKNWFHQRIFRHLLEIEFEVYRNKRKTDYPHRVEIEAVSQALKDYLVEHYRSEPAHISLAINDIPPHISTEQKTEWREQVRDELKIPSDAYVLAYAGSAKPWQCLAEMFLYFFEQRKKNSRTYFLVLSQDKKQFDFFLRQSKIPAEYYRILNVPPHQVLKYLSAADAGLLFRRRDVINWVSRPTKMLEYQAVGLEIIHNDTVEMLVRKKRQQ